MVWDIPPSNMLEVRHRIYTEAEKRFLDYIDIGLKDEKNIKFQFEMHRLWRRKTQVRLPYLPYRFVTPESLERS